MQAGQPPSSSKDCSKPLNYLWQGITPDRLGGHPQFRLGFHYYYYYHYYYLTTEPKVEDRVDSIYLRQSLQ